MTLPLPFTLRLWAVRHCQFNKGMTPAFEEHIRCLMATGSTARQAREQLILNAAHFLGPQTFWHLPIALGSYPPPSIMPSPYPSPLTLLMLCPSFAFALATFVFFLFLKVPQKVLHIAARYREKIGSLNSGKHWDRNHSFIPS